MLDEEVPLVLGRLAVLRSDDAGGPVQVEHVDELLLLLLQLLDLGLQVGVDALQLLGLLQGGGNRGKGNVRAAFLRHASLGWLILRVFLRAASEKTGISCENSSVIFSQTDES